MSKKIIQLAAHKARDAGTMAAWKKSKGESSEHYENKRTQLVCALDMLEVLPFGKAQDIVHSAYWEAYEKELEFQKSTLL